LEAHTSARRLLLSLILILSACRTAPPPAPPADPPGNPVFNDAARFLAGLPGRPGGAYTSLESLPAWKGFSTEMNQVWSRAEQRRVLPVRSFQQNEIPGPAAGATFAFYPFSGPDVLYLHGFFPHAQTSVLAGLEPPGSIPEQRAYTNEELASLLHGVRQGSNSLLARSFFITAEMSRQLRGQLVDGVLPISLMLLARSGFTIDDVQLLSLTPDGRPDPRPYPSPTGLEIRYHRPGDPAPRKLFYFRIDLGPGLDKNPAFLAFLDSLGQPETLIKSASFLLHTRPFSRLRQHILARSARIVQDDTGVPFALLRDRGWRLRLYGAYSRPDPPFRSLFQPALAAAFDSPSAAKPLGFAIGYGTGRRPSHLVIADRP
jgi:hypothetical protein